MDDTGEKILLLKDVALECHRFMKRIADYQTKLIKNKYAIYGCKEAASCKRASMDLSNMLVKLRRG